MRTGRRVTRLRVKKQKGGSRARNGGGGVALVQGAAVGWRTGKRTRPGSFVSLSRKLG